MAERKIRSKHKVIYKNPLITRSWAIQKFQFLRKIQNLPHDFSPKKQPYPLKLKQFLRMMAIFAQSNDCMDNIKPCYPQWDSRVCYACISNQVPTISRAGRLLTIFCVSKLTVMTRRSSSSG